MKYISLIASVLFLLAPALVSALMLKPMATPSGNGVIQFHSQRPPGPGTIPNPEHDKPGGIVFILLLTIVALAVMSTRQQQDQQQGHN